MRNEKNYKNVYIIHKNYNEEKYYNAGSYFIYCRKIEKINSKIISTL